MEDCKRISLYQNEVL